MLSEETEESSIFRVSAINITQQGELYIVETANKTVPKKENLKCEPRSHSDFRRAKWSFPEAALHSVCLLINFKNKTLFLLHVMNLISRDGC